MKTFNVCNYKRRSNSCNDGVNLQFHRLDKLYFSFSVSFVLLLSYNTSSRLIPTFLETSSQNNKYSIE